MQIIKSDGMGVESVETTREWDENPASMVAAGHPFTWKDVIIITAQTGDEHADTISAMTKFVLPIYRKHQVRFVEVARAGPSMKQGIRVLQDTRAPRHLHPMGAYRLSEELRAAGSVPLRAGTHLCSLKFKADVIEHWLAHYYEGSGLVRHAFGYNVDEPKRAKESVAASKRRNEKVYMAFGFNAEEISRSTHATGADTSVKRAIIREAFFPLIDWRRTREECIINLQKRFKIIWKKSACVGCPFNSQVSKSTPAGLARLDAHPRETAAWMMLEHAALSISPTSGSLFGARTLERIARENNLAAVALFDRSLEDSEWAVYRVRRILSKLGVPPARCTEIISRHRSQAEAACAFEPLKTSGTVRHLHGRDYVYVSTRGTDYPKCEEYFVIAPAVVEEKARYGVAYFEESWRTIRQPQATLFAL